MKDMVEPQAAARLLRFARETIGKQLGVIEEVDDSLRNEKCLQQSLATFVTLRLKGKLRGCIGNLHPVGAIWESTGRNALQAAFHDHRFSPLTLLEFDQVHLDISILSEAQMLEYTEAEDLLRCLVPQRDGVILRLGGSGATFLPQVWQQLPDPEDFLSHLCLKAGLPRSSWRHDHPEIKIYQVVCFEEEEK